MQQSGQSTIILLSWVEKWVREAVLHQRVTLRDYLHASTAHRIRVRQKNAYTVLPSILRPSLSRRSLQREPLFVPLMASFTHPSWASCLWRNVASWCCVYSFCVSVFYFVSKRVFVKRCLYVFSHYFVFNIEHSNFFFSPIVSMSILCFRFSSLSFPFFTKWEFSFWGFYM